MERAHVQSVALFFFFSLMDERQALRATFKTIEDLKKTTSRHQGAKQLEHSEIVRLTQQNWEHQKKFLLPIGGTTPHVEGWIPPQGLDLGPWRQFRKQAPPGDLLAVIWSRILGFTEQEIAGGLGLSHGTIQYRISNGLKLLGTMTPLGSHNG